MPERTDKWWYVRPDTDIDSLGTELASAVEQYGLPAMRAEMPSVESGEVRAPGDA